MVLMQLWLMSRVVRFLHTWMTAETGQPDSAPSASHCENSLASGTRIDWRSPSASQYTHQYITYNILHKHVYYRVVFNLNSTIIDSVEWWILRVAKLDLRDDKP